MSVATKQEVWVWVLDLGMWDLRGEEGENWEHLEHWQGGVVLMGRGGGACRSGRQLGGKLVWFLARGLRGCGGHQGSTRGSLGLPWGRPTLGSRVRGSHGGVAGVSRDRAARGRSGVLPLATQRFLSLHAVYKAKKVSKTLTYNVCQGKVRGRGRLLDFLTGIPLLSDLLEESFLFLREATVNLGATTLTAH